MEYDPEMQRGRERNVADQSFFQETSSRPVLILPWSQIWSRFGSFHKHILLLMLMHGFVCYSSSFIFYMTAVASRALFTVVVNRCAFTEMELQQQQMSFLLVVMPVRPGELYVHVYSENKPLEILF